MSNQNELDQQIYEAMIAMGWLIPATVEGVQIAEEALEREETPLLPATLADPSEFTDRLKATLDGEWEEV